MITVLVAEDDPITARLYAMHFKRHDITGVFFTTGQELLAAALAERPQVVILDFELPDLKGQEVLERLHQLPGCAEVPVIFVTARTKGEVETDLLKAGASAVLAKPFSPTNLIDLIQACGKAS
jgi:CheY-like chemotaxis protein